MLNDVFISGFPELVGLYQFIHSFYVVFRYTCISVSSSYAFGRCFWFSESLVQLSVLLFLQFACNNSVSVFCKPYFLEMVKVLNHCLVFIAKWHFTLLVLRRCIKSIILNVVFLFLSTNIRNA